MSEPAITINNTQLTYGQAMAVRVAITSFHSKMSTQNALGADSRGEAIRQGYVARLSEVLTLILK